MVKLLVEGLSTELLVIGLLTIALSWWISYKWKRREIDRLGALIPGPPPLPIIGNTFEWIGDSIDVLAKCEEYFTMYGSTVRAWLGPRLVIVIASPEDMEIVLKSSSTLHKDPVYRFLKVVGEGIFSAPVEKWKVHRKHISPAFNTKLLEEYMKIFNEMNKILLKKMEDEIGKGEFDVIKYIEPMNLDTICKTAMGVDCDAQENPRNEIAHAIKRVQELSFARVYTYWMHSDILYSLFGPKKECARVENELREFASNVIQKRKNRSLKEKAQVGSPQGLANGGSRKPRYFLDILLELSEDGANLTDEDIIDEVLTMMIGGSDTSTLAISFCLLALAMHPHIQEKVYEEVTEVLGNRDVTLEDCSRLVYLEMVIKESLRRFTIGPIIMRTNSETIKLTSYTVPPGCSIALAFMAMHNDDKIYPDPSRFDPERFSEENIKKRHPFSFLPFSGGPRGCIGLRYGMLTMKTTISHIIRTYRLETTCKIEDIRMKLDLFSRSVDGYPVKIVKR